MIDVAKEDALTIITIDRPDKANSLTTKMLHDILEAVSDLGDTKVLVLTGKGRVFSAGADLDEARTGLATHPVWEDLSGAISSLPILTIAALNGTLAGGAFGMALACDIRLAVPSARFFYPVMKLGFLPQPSDPARLRTLVGPSGAKRLLMAGEKIEADEALRIGLVDQIVGQEQLMPTAVELSEPALSADLKHIAGIKRLI